MKYVINHLAILFTWINPFYEMAGGLPHFEEIPNLSANPNQPQWTAFQKRSFGKAKLIYQSFQASWFKEFPFFCPHYKVKDVAF